ncbi:cathepsin K-like [Leguminivora glycinivorella]|uniref:cathepsin K-like n=1 Tax=Leguminivora glycinivorella TaxID=1035111 RepID=UPI00200E75C0|nr:cathepsin K-like [Leguminivora glycinivorella]
MAVTVAVLFLVYLFNLSSGYVLMDDDDNLDEVLTLPSEYSINAERIDLIADLKLPMKLWYSTEFNRSRVDVYDGMVKRYYYWGEDGATGTDGTIYMAYPKWTEKEGHTVFCSKIDMDQESTNDAFPTEEEYVYAGKSYHEGRKVDVWKFREEDGDTRTELVLYSYRTERGEDVPVQVEKQEFNTMLGSLEKHVIFNYDQFNPLFCEEDVDAEKETSCEWTPDDFDGHMKMLHPAFHGDLDKAFNSFKKHHDRNYQDKKEHDLRRDIFHKNWKFVVDHNRQNLGFKLALNHLSDLTPAERKHMSGGRRSKNPSATIPFPHSERQVGDIMAQIPEEYDMRLEGIISPVKNQDKCGSCWTFATAAAVEGALARLDGRILDLSEQSIVDCSWEGENEGCNGGFPKEALKHIMKHGIPLEEDYGGYLNENGYCHLENVTEVFKIRGFTMVTPLSVSAMKVALYKYGPVIVTIQNNEAFNFYHSGVFYDHTCVNDYVGHAVTIVGYGSRDGADYWIVKNSFGQQWGQDGYMLLSSLHNNCFVLNEPYYPVV